ncbi:hypothetical protein C3K47_07675 [Solitalea longa]|uniref:Cytochrome c domain-containing protein n=1 Tax=Solitalea longa TaxID=2079460 RepID=A0A2S5A335_9SPHI|nr:hypothetical protein [Solitalea longa]POY36934.1 hypothetical protein C3K47_07675 [Solitalea longa]
MLKGIIMTLVATTVLMSCTRMAPETEPEDNGPSDCSPVFPDKQVTYNGYVKHIIAAHCTQSCHRGGNTLGTGNFTSYEGLKPFANDNFYIRVVQDNADMPQGMAPLPKSTRDSLNVWLKNCIPEN